MPALQVKLFLDQVRSESRQAVQLGVWRAGLRISVAHAGIPTRWRDRNESNQQMASPSRIRSRVWRDLLEKGRAPTPTSDDPLITMLTDGLNRRIFHGVLVGPVVLLLIGIALGVLLHKWGPLPEAETESADPHAEESEHPGEGSGIVSIPVEAQRTGSLTTARAEVREIETSVHLTGVVGADRARVSRIAPLAHGVVTEVFVNLGDYVKLGDPLISFDNVELGVAVAEFISASADLRGAQAALAAQEVILARSSQMLEVGAIARTEYEIRAARHRASEAKVRAQRSRAAQYEEQLHRFGLSEDETEKLLQSDAAMAHREMSISTLSAPFSGLVTEYDVSLGETIDEANHVLTITDLSTVWVLASVFEHHLEAIHEGKRVEVHVDAYPDITFMGRVTYIADFVNLETRSTEVRCEVENPGLRLKLGMSARIDVSGEHFVGALTVPASSIQTLDGRKVVFVRESDSTFAVREVEVGVETAGWIAIRGGLSLGETVIKDGSFYAKTAVLRGLIGDHH